jgi:hypothetical protein
MATKKRRTVKEWGVLKAREAQINRAIDITKNEIGQLPSLQVVFGGDPTIVPVTVVRYKVLAALERLRASLTGD